MTTDTLPPSWQQTRDEGILGAAKIAYYTWANNAVQATLTPFDSLDEYAKLHWLNIATCTVGAYLEHVAGALDAGTGQRPGAANTNIHEPQGS
jgi:hypothetical protein